MHVLNHGICKKVTYSQRFCSVSSAILAETGREVPAEQARADCLWVPSAGGLGVCSPPSWARSDAALQTLGAELLALAALRGRGSWLFPLGSPEPHLLLEMQNQTPDTSLALSPEQFFQQCTGDTALTQDSQLWQIYVIITFSRQVKTELLVNG